MAKMFIFFFFLFFFFFFSDWLVKIHVTLSRWFLHKTAAYFTEQYAIFSSRIHMRTNHLATKCNYLCKIAELEILLVCGECLKKACESSDNTA